MGNWRTVHIIGTVAPEHLQALRDACNPHRGGQYVNFHPLVTSASIAGLNDWPAPTMDVVGNLAERDYSVEAVERQLLKLVGAAPSLTLKVHCGGDNETTECIATITARDGDVHVGPPEVAEVGELGEPQIRANFMRALRNAQRFSSTPDMSEPEGE